MMAALEIDDVSDDNSSPIRARRPHRYPRHTRPRHTHRR